MKLNYFLKLSFDLIKSKLITFSFGIIFSTLFFVLLLQKLPDTFIDSRTLNLLTKQFEKNYDFHIITLPLKPEINPSIIIWGNDKHISESCDDFKLNETSKKPFLKIYKKNDFSILSFLPFFKLDYKLYSQLEFDFNTHNKPPMRGPSWISEIKTDDLNGDGKDEIIVKAFTTSCASRGNQFNIVLNEDGRNLKLTESLPFIVYNKTQLTNTSISQIEKLFNESQILLSQKKQKVFYTSIDSYIHYEDLDNDNLKEMIIGYPILEIENWGKENNCHSCPHTWLIGVYKFNGKQFIIDNNWSYGNLYVTPKKIGLYDALGYPARNNNIFNLFYLYYFDCKNCDAFYNSSRRKSELLKIVETNYANFKSLDELNEIN